MAGDVIGYGVWNFGKFRRGVAFVNQFEMYSWILYVFSAIFFACGIFKISG